MSNQFWASVLDSPVPSYPVLVLAQRDILYTPQVQYPLVAMQWLNRKDGYPVVPEGQLSKPMDYIDGYGRALYNEVTHWLDIPLWDSANSKMLEGWHTLEGYAMPYQTPVLVMAEKSLFHFPFVVRRYYPASRGWQKNSEGEIYELLDAYDRGMRGIVTHWLELPAWDGKHHEPIHKGMTREERIMLWRKDLQKQGIEVGE